MYVVQTDAAHGDVADMLETYRKELLESKPRKPDESGKEVVTRYYRMDERIADDLFLLLPRVVDPETWVNEQRPNAVGTITKVASRPELLDAQGRPVFPADGNGQQSKNGTLVVTRSVLIVRQTRDAHDEIAELITRVEQGDPQESKPQFRGGGGFGGGGFGGGIIGK